MHAFSLLIADVDLAAGFELAQDGPQVTGHEPTASYAGPKWMDDGTNPQTQLTA